MAESRKRKNRRNSKSTVKKTNNHAFNMKNEDIPTDILGSYTGVPLNPLEVPVQDADDL